MSWLAILLLVQSSAPALTAEEEKARPHTYATYWRVVLGAGSVPRVAGPDLDLTLDFGAHSFGGAFSTGVSTSLATAFDGRWFIVAPGLFIQLDLTYVVATRFWTRPPPLAFPFHFLVGSRLGVGLSKSFPSKVATPWASPYFLIRPELHTFIDVEFPFGPQRRHSFVLRGAVDTPVTLSSNVADPFRWSVSAGISWGIGR